MLVTKLPVEGSFPTCCCAEYGVVPRHIASGAWPPTWARDASMTCTLMRRLRVCTRDFVVEQKMPVNDFLLGITCVLTRHVFGGHS